MSIFFGCIDFSGKSDRKAISNKIFNAHKELPHNAYNEMHLEQASFGELIRHNTPDSLFDHAPLQYKDWIICSYSRLDNREELAKKLHFPIGKLAETPDNELLARAYEQWNEQCIHELKGLWVFSVWDKQKKELFLAKDFLGNAGIYYHHNNDFFAFSTTIKGLVHIEQISKELNPVAMALGVVRVSLPKGNTQLTAIKTIPSAHYLKFSAGKIELKQYWSLDNIKPILYPNYEDYTAHFLELYEQSVRNCLRTTGIVGTMLSGGLDSGSVTALAAREMQKQDKTIYSFTSVPRHFTNNLGMRNRFVDEKEHASSVAAMYPNIKHELVYGEEKSIMQTIAETNKYCTLFNPSASNMYWILKMSEQAKDLGVKVLLSGQVGNLTVSWTGLSYKNMPYSEYLKQKGSNALFRRMVKDTFPFLGTLKRKRDVKANVELFNSAYYKEHNILRLSTNELKKWNTIEHTNSLKRRDYLVSPTLTPGGAGWQDNAHAFGLEIPDPTANRALLEFCWGVPDEICYDGKTDRKLIRTAMQGLLPDKVRMEVGKGIQGIDNWNSLKRDYKEIRAFFMEMKKNELFCYYLNPDACIKKLDDMVHDFTLQAFYMHGQMIIRILSFGMFLRDYSTGKWLSN